MCHFLNLQTGAEYAAKMVLVDSPPLTSQSSGNKAFTETIIHKYFLFYGSEETLAWNWPFGLKFLCQRPAISNSIGFPLIVLSGSF